MDLLRPEFDVVGRLPDPSDIQFYFKVKDVSPCEFAKENFKLQAIFREYLLSQNEKKITLFKRIVTE